MGDTNTAAFQLVHLADINYLVFDYLSEITMSIMAKAKMVEPKHGYALDFVSRVMAPLLKKIAEKRLRSLVMQVVLTHWHVEMLCKK